MKVLAAFILCISTTVIAQDAQYCEQGPRTEKTIDGFDHRFCFGTKEYMAAFANKLQEQKIPHHVYKNGDIGYPSGYEKQVQEIGNELLYKYIFTAEGKARGNL
jgi:hypothetical protein